jgi:ABC-type transport system involved in multi-copper enzyme maturation permease subunit
MVISPTSRLEILLGKLLGTFVTCLVQVLFLFLALTLVGSLMSGALTLIWGSNVIGILATVIAVALAATGLSAFVIAFVRSAETGNTIGGIVAMFMGIFGGVFFDVTQVPALVPLSRLTITYWGTNAFTQLAANQSDIALNLLVLAGMGVILFSAGFAVFSRRLQF